MDLLYLEGKEGQNHNVYIKDFDRFMFCFTEHKGQAFFQNLLKNFYSKENLAKHRKDCIVINGVQAVELPEPYIDRNGVERIPSVFFKKNYHKQLPLPFVIIADLECNLEKISSCQPSDKNSYTEKYQKHTACSFGYKVVCHYDMKYSKDVVI